jgi:hypothetical protein
MNPIPTPPSRILLLVIGFIVWSVAFVALYAINAIGCTFKWDPAFQRSFLIGLFLVHAVFLIWFAWKNIGRLRMASGQPDRMIAYTGLGLTVAALGSTIFVLAPSVFVSMCI